jgi:hypothetical protein
MRVMIVVSADFGELANALYLLEGTAAVDAQLMLPPRLYEQNRELAPHAVASYHNAAELVVALHRFQPQVLLLMSGYLFGVNGLLNVDDLRNIVAEAHAMRIAIATTDPFLGILSHLGEHTFIHAQRDALVSHLAAVERVLGDVTPVYLSPPPDETNSKSFYNPGVEIPRDKAAVADPYWLFVLSLEDYVSQCSVAGRSVFDETLVRLMNETISADRRPVMLLPGIARQSVAPSAPVGARVLDFCDCRSFRGLLLNAEYVFYWNIFSNSILVRIANVSPIFFFDRGHLARSIPSLIPIAMRSYFANAELPMLDPRQRLNADAVGAKAKEQSVTFAPTYRAFHALPSPDEMLRSIAAGDAH